MIGCTIGIYFYLPQTFTAIEGDIDEYLMFLFQWDMSLYVDTHVYFIFVQWLSGVYKVIALHWFHCLHARFYCANNYYVNGDLVVTV